MTVYRIAEDDHGFLAIAKNYRSAIHYLIEHEWLNGHSEAWNGEDWVNIKEALGEDWKDKVYEMSLDDFVNYFEGHLYIWEEPVYCID